MKYLLDTDICIYLMKHSPPQVERRFARLHVGDAVMSVITHGELMVGCHKLPDTERRISALGEMTSKILVEPLPAECGAHYGEIRCALERAGKPIGPNDLWLAAHARSKGLTLVTNNTREFSRVSGLRLENWLEG
jgi:tRNA(fMet)-specific endonuclease VapC